MAPKGKLLIIGGAEERYDGRNSETQEKNEKVERFEILKEVLPKGKHDGRIEVITTASRIPDEMQDIYENTFREIGYSNVGFLKIEDKAQARQKDYRKRIEDAQAVFFTGGDQLRLSTTISGTDLLASIREKYIHEEDFTVAGTSAGAMAIPNLMICGGGITEALIGLDLNLASGLGLLSNCIVDTHFIKRGRFSRLAHAVIINPGNLGIGLGENTALLINKGEEAICKGSGMVVLIDGSAIERTNISEADAGSPVYVENLKVHLLSQHCKFNLKTHQMEPPPSQ